MYFSGIYTNMKRKIENSDTEVANVEETGNNRKKKVRFEKPVNNKITSKKEKSIFKKLSRNQNVIKLQTIHNYKHN
jgi:hypothetical protein